LFLPTGEGAPSKIEGVGGVFRKGYRGRFPLAGLGSAHGFSFDLARLGVLFGVLKKGVADHTPNEIWYSVLHQNKILCYAQAKFSGRK